ncbi:MAG TPA: secretin N-terminal domain-containing protein [Burkholderiales bacterium]|nr:secretin N-terminal domain-containing protein [Burkholderiales bacterium]
MNARPTSPKRASETPRCVGVWYAAAGLTLALAACAYKPTIPPSEGHLSRQSVAPPGEADKILPPVTNATYVPPPTPRAKTPTYSVVVHEVPVKELLLALARDTKENIDIHPGLQGLVSLNAIDETLPAILDRVAKQVNMRYRVEGKTIVVSPDTPYFKTYKVNYVNMTRDTKSDIAVSGQISGGGGAAGITTSTGGTSSTSVNSVSKNNFWEVLTENLQSLLKSTRALAQSADDRQAQAEAARAAREERLAQAEAVARAGQNATNLFEKVFGSSSSAVTDVKQDIVVNQVAGTVSVMATERQHQLVQEYLSAIGSSSQRQVLIEATVAEVSLSDQYQAGIDWSKLTIGAGFGASQTLSTAPILTAGVTAPTTAAGLTLSYLSNTNGNGVQFTAKLLEQFGKTRVLSSPMLMAMNNQTALLKVVDNVVYFQIQSQIAQATSTTGSNLQSITTTPQTVAVGFIMSMTPQVNSEGVVTLTVRPTITRVEKFVNDPNPVLTTSANGTPLPNPQVNPVPQVTVREMESVLQLISGQTAVLGGLITDEVDRSTAQVPGLGNIPRLGEAFQYRNDNVIKTELVIFIRPTVVKNPALDSEELKHLRKFLPDVDQTGQNP